MLRFLTHKLRSQSLNEEQQFQNKAHDDHDSGTESDDESGNPNEFSEEHYDMEHEEGWDENRQGLFNSLGSMNSISGDGVPGGRDSVSSEMFESGYNIDSALPSDSDLAYDHHSSEEELEVINNTSYDDADDDAILGPEETGSLLGDEDESGLVLRNWSENKRKWSQVASNRLSVESTSSSDDEVQGLLRPLSTPVEFCTSPPVDAHKPSRSQSPPPKLFLFSSAAVAGEVGGNSVGGVAIQDLPSAGGTRPICSTSSPVSSLSNSSGPGALMNGSGNSVFRGLRRNDHHNNPYPIMSSSVSSTTSSYKQEAPTHNFILNNTISSSSGPIINFTCGGPVVLHSELLPSSTTNHHSFLNTTLITNSLSPTTNLVENNVSSSSPAAPSTNLVSLHNSSSSTVSSSTFGTGRHTRTTTGREIARRRHRHHHNPRHIQRPWLDFEKMQQFKETGKSSSGRTCDVTSGGGSSNQNGGSSGGDPSCYNSDAEFVSTDESKQGGNATAPANATMMSFKENQRMKVAKELLETERKYCHTLKTIQETFALPLKNSGILSMKDINTLFPEEVFKLYEKHCDLLSQLEERVASWKTQPTVGDLLERFINGEDANVLRLYTSYVNDFPEVLKTFHKLCRSSTDFTRFLKSTLEHPTCGGLDLGAFLLTPVQRMPRYILLLKQMMKFTDASHPDYKNISLCLDRLREYLKRLNDSMEHSFQLVTAQISPQPHEPLLEKLMGFSGKNHFPRASTSSQSSTGGENDQIVHKVRYKRSTSVPRSSHSSASEAGGPKSMPPGAGGPCNAGGQKEGGKSKLKSRSKSDWTVCNNNGSKNSIVEVENEDGHAHGHGKCMSCNCANSTGNVPHKLHNGGGGGSDGKHHSRFKGKKNIFERTLSDSDINSDWDEGSLEEKDSATRKFSTSKSLHDFNQDDDEIDGGNLEWFISEPSLCEMKHGAHHRPNTASTPDDEEDMSLTRNSSSLRRNMMIRPMTTNPSGRVVARLTRASESEMNLHMLEKSSGDKEGRPPKNKGKMSLRNSLKNIFSIKKRSNRGLQISHPIPPTLSENGSTTNTTPSMMSFDFLHHLEHQSMPDPTMHCGQSNCTISTNPLRSMTPSGGSLGEETGNSNSSNPKPPMSLPYVTSTASMASISTNSSVGVGAGPSSITGGQNRYVKNKLAQPKFPRTPFVRKHSNALTNSSSGGSDVYKMI